jgi:hypothetical protein
MYADTILINARTGKQLKTAVSQASNSQAASHRNNTFSKSGDFGKGPKKNAF